MSDEGLNGVVIPLRREPIAAGLHPADQLFQQMLDGWRAQQLARGLNLCSNFAPEQEERHPLPE